MVARSKPNELRITRVYDAPVAAVWDAWTDPDQAAQWWGPRGFTITTHSKDLRPGGSWDYTMHGPDGVDWPNTTLYHEVVEYEKLVYDHGGAADRPPLFRVTVLFSESEGKTTMDMTMTMASPEAAEQIKQHIKDAGGNATWDRLAEHLGMQSTGKECFVINRSFDAPIDVVFDMWTLPEHIVRWLPPTGFVMELLREETRVGGKSFYRMVNEAGVELFGCVEYREIERPDRLVSTQEFCDAEENLSRHPMAPVWPATMLRTVTFTAEGPQSTRVTVVWEPIGHVTPAERAAFVEERSGMTQGWTGSFDKLEALLAAG
ncbi:hypothetical protein Pla108_25100 [Botrimarina colliarenosi]|uniref:Activator of Hsp90 ATPase homologue 1/2-like C-terminal domain-containing protein n=1 Tax=Botrimarina colliarenosi TaxID=2528001 RepID=A0A5C6ABA6_9BACT|nr:SRPBCC family protein [Botrimarina colliarenosi]TWT96736.1 hypothetical protein Pla108_25100 [Botrimarina colliarenosi]